VSRALRPGVAPDPSGEPGHRLAALPARPGWRHPAAPGGPLARGAGEWPAISSPRVLVRAARPRQWPKNILVLTAPAAAGVLLQPRAALATGVAVVAFILASSAVYLANDIVDRDADRAHPTKRRRPVASGELPASDAWFAAVLLLAGGLLVAALLGWRLLIIVALYVAVQLLYCLGLKRVPLVELLIVASGFLLRAFAGGAATGVPLTAWFIVAVGSGSLFVVAGKRSSELVLAERSTAAIRPVLARYRSSQLRFVWALSASVLLATYALWATIGPAAPDGWAIVSVLPFTLAVLRHATKVNAGGAGEPEEVFLHDRVLQGLLVVWAACFMASVYL
jgi:decaprenyl-phosphate phosphoribosyltransferase